MSKELEKQFKAYIKKFKKSGLTCFTIANTTKQIDRFYFTPARFLDDISICGVVVSNSDEASSFARLADGKFDYIAVDSEKKIEPGHYISNNDAGNIEGEILDIVKKSKVIDFKANDVTVNALDIFIGEKMMGVPSRKVAIIGMGNIGFKIAQKLLERGYWVNLYRRDFSKLKVQAECLNLTKPKGTKAVAAPFNSIDDCVKDVHVVVATSSSSHILTKDHIDLAGHDALLIDCGKACFSNEVCSVRTVFRTDAGYSLLYQLKNVIRSINELHKRFGIRNVSGKRYVCGVSGVKGDIVVSDLNDLNSVLGICDGEGGFIKDHDSTLSQNEVLDG